MISSLKTKLHFAGLLALVLIAFPIMAETRAPPLQQQLAASNNAFAYDLYARLKGAQGNLFFSPFSVSTALAMTCAGAKADTATQMQEVLHFPASQSETHAGFAALLKDLDDTRQNNGVQLEMANSLWPQQGAHLLENYLALVKQHYGVSITPVDYQHGAPAAADQINRWVEEKTHGKIDPLVYGLPSLTRLVLVNAVYFKGDWMFPFSPAMTEEAPFFTGDDRIPVALMAETEDLSYTALEGVQLIELPYVGDRLSMLVILPSDKTAAGLNKLENQLTQKQLADWQARMHSAEVHVFLPKFKLEWGAASLAKPLQKLGMTDAFDEDKADFSGVNGLRAKDSAQGLYIGDVVHKAFIAVDEQGTEASAATEVLAMAGAAAGMAHVPIPVFRADHPFLFLIQDRASQSILFMGRVTNPSTQ